MQHSYLGNVPDRLEQEKLALGNLSVSYSVWK